MGLFDFFNKNTVTPDIYNVYLCNLYIAKEIEGGIVTHYEPYRQNALVYLQGDEYIDLDTKARYHNKEYGPELHDIVPLDMVSVAQIVDIQQRSELATKIEQYNNKGRR